MLISRSPVQLNVALGLRSETVGKPPRSNQGPLGAQLNPVSGKESVLEEVAVVVAGVAVAGVACTSRAVVLAFRPPEESLHQKCSTLRGGLDSSTPGVFRVLRVAVFEG